MIARLKSNIPTVVGALVLVAFVLTAYTVQEAFATHSPANKVSASGTNLDTWDYYVDGENDDVTLLSEQMKVSSPTDLILEFTAECAVDTYTETGGESDGGPAEQYSYGSDIAWVITWIEIDGRRVAQSEDDKNGEVTLCRREQYQEAWESEEQQDPECIAERNAPPPLPQRDRCDDGLDGMAFWQTSRMANGFNWLALNGGTYYDDPANGQNILDIVVKARIGVDCDEWDESFCWAKGFIGDRTLIVEPTQASNHELVTQDGTDATKK